MRIRHLHDGGFLWPVDRADREPSLRELYVAIGRYVVVASSDSAAATLAERLVLSGMPVLVASSQADPGVLDDFLADERNTLVTTDAYLHAHPGLRTGVVVYMRVAEGSRALKRRRGDIKAAVHLTFVVPEDVRRAEHLASHFGQPTNADAVIDLTGDAAVAAVIDLTDASAHERGPRRRRFPLPR